MGKLSLITKELNVKGLSSRYFQGVVSITTRQVIHYNLIYSAKKDTPQVMLSLQGDAEGKVRFTEIIPVKLENLLYVIYMLRYEKSV
ncbi:MAG: hypothetical protein RBG13Loki_3799 [Promethearchaeota archaeon CR_4]|nr:MAG: hypothetical protein RBG13Loki_3799 [Candidatus Lokiarchaeota archaeon CR_4]